MRIKKYRTFMGDFETTVYKDQSHTEVWASACVELFTDEVKIFNSIAEQFNYFVSLNTNLIVYYHNLKFDGTFWISYLLQTLHYDLAVERYGDEENEVTWLKDRFMKNKTFKCSISDRGQWYTIIVKVKNRFIEFRDSLKLLPFSVKRIGESFGTKHKKLEMEYKGFRFAGCEITEAEKKYIANDVLVVKEALEIMYNEGHKKLTIGSCCLSEYESIIGKDKYQLFFPDLYNIRIDQSAHGDQNVGQWIRHSYRGGWCYLVKGKENKIFTNGTTADVNSLYPSVMSSESGCRYPLGVPKFWTGNYIPDEAIGDDKYYFVRVRTRFYIKKDKLPFIQIKHSFLYKGTEMLTTSDVKDIKTGRYFKTLTDENGDEVDTRVTMTLTMTDYALLKEHYDLVDFEILDGCWFYAITGLFDDYIEKYKKIKLESKGAQRELAKLFLNNLYGKFASNTDSSFKVPYLAEDRSVKYFPVYEQDKTPGYIPIGSAITSYARDFTIRAAQKNYYGVDKPGFIYADTDSIHCDLQADQMKGIKVDDKAFCHWKLESQWDRGIFVRQKTYIEHVVGENLEPIDKPYYNVKCAGMPSKCKHLFLLSMQNSIPWSPGLYTEEEKEFLRNYRTLEDFKVGLIVPGKLMPKHIEGGTILVDTTYEMR